MLFIGDKNHTQFWSMLTRCQEVAKQATCLRSKCGALIVKDETILGRGFNRPPHGEQLHQCKKDALPSDFKSDKTCCIHAEQMAIIDAYENGYKKEDFRKSTMYFVRLDENDKITFSGRPYCTICSKMWMEVSGGEGFWVLLHESSTWGREGFYLYGSIEYNEVSFAYRKILF